MFMRTKEINGIINDLLELINWKNPMWEIGIKRTYEINLLNGNLNNNLKDDLTKYLSEKYKCFSDRIKELKGKMNDFGEAKIKLFIRKEKITIKYKGKTFEKERIY